MPYKDRQKQRDWMREWARRRRAEWLATQVCSRCAGSENLHIFGAKANGSGAFTGSEAKRAEKLKDAVVICTDCLSTDRERLAVAANERRNERRRKPGSERAQRPRREGGPRSVQSGESRSASPEDKSRVQTFLNDVNRREQRKAWREQRRRELGYGSGGEADDD